MSRPEKGLSRLGNLFLVSTVPVLSDQAFPLLFQDLAPASNDCRRAGAQTVEHRFVAVEKIVESRW